MHPIIQKMVEAEMRGKIVPEEIYNKLSTLLQEEGNESIRDYFRHITSVMVPAALSGNIEHCIVCIYKLMAVGYMAATGVDAPPLDPKKLVDDFFKEHNLKVKEDTNHEQK